jgi:hypothetical protein
VEDEPWAVVALVLDCQEMLRGVHAQIGALRKY